MNYIILEASTIEKLMEKVESKLNEGYMPKGGVAVADGLKLIYVQAMLKQ